MVEMTSKERVPLWALKVSEISHINSLVIDHLYMFDMLFFLSFLLEQGNVKITLRHQFLLITFFVTFNHFKSPWQDSPHVGVLLAKMER